MLYAVTIILFLVFYALFCYTYGDDYLSAIRWLCCIAMAAVLAYPGIKLSVFWEIPPIWASIIAMVLYLALYFLGGLINERIPMDPTLHRNGDFYFSSNVLQADDKTWSTAYYRNPTKFRDGIVYVHPSNWSFRRVVIARYRYTDDSHQNIIVVDAYSRKRIGFVIPGRFPISRDHELYSQLIISSYTIPPYDGCIYLSREHEVYLRQKADKDLSGKKCPEPSKLVAAYPNEHLSGCIVNDHRILGRYDRGGIGAAAAFIALTSTFHTQTEYANYQVDWEFED